MSSRFFVPPEQIQGKQFVVTGSEARHAALVLRKKVGDLLDLFDGKNLSFQGRIDSISPEQISGTICEKTTSRQEPLVSVTLYQGLIKGSRWDWLVEKACELGAARLVPLVTARTIVKPSANGVERWKRIALSASKQSGRVSVMDIAQPQKFVDAIQALPKDGFSFIPWEKEEKKAIKDVIPAGCKAGIHVDPPLTTAGDDAAYKMPSIHLFIGPEGGWDIQEVDFARRKGVIPVTIGRTLLRAETAGLVALAQVFSEIGE